MLRKSHGWDLTRTADRGKKGRNGSGQY